MNLSPLGEEHQRSDVAAVARRSMRASYALSPDKIDTIVDEEFTASVLAEKADRSDVIFIIARRDEEIVGFAEGVVAEDGADIRWLHVDPPSRGGGVGTHLFERLRDEFWERDVDEIRARVLAEDLEGSAFFERFGFEQVAGSDIEIGGEGFVEEVYSASGEAVTKYDEDHEPPEQARTDEGTAVHVESDDPLSGTVAPFFRAFTSPDGEDPHGYLCGNCETVTTTVDQQGRIKCPECGNVHRPADWDASYL